MLQMLTIITIFGNRDFLLSVCFRDQHANFFSQKLYLFISSERGVLNDLYSCVAGRAYWKWERSQITRRRESLILYKSFSTSTLWAGFDLQGRIRIRIRLDEVKR
jgi:hypothetical protein